MTAREYLWIMKTFILSDNRKDTIAMTVKSMISLACAAALALMMTAGCAAPGASLSLPSTKVMDFDAPLTLKKPAEPVKESP